MKLKSRWKDAGDLLMECGNKYQVLKLFLEAATVFTEASEEYIKVDKFEAIKALRKSIKAYCDHGRFDIAGKLERKVAQLHFESKHWDDAAFHFKKAADFLSGENFIFESDSCLEKCAECLIQINQVHEASKLLEIIAVSCVNSNLRRFYACEYLLRSIFCLVGIPIKSFVQDNTENGKKSLSIPNHLSIKNIEQFDNKYEKYDYILSKLNSYESMDFLWKTSMEYKFLKTIIGFRLNMSINEFIDHVYFWNNARSFDKFSLKLSQVMLNEMESS
jgi:tetratricopeptide (TPR) repeat protein